MRRLLTPTAAPIEARSHDSGQAVTEYVLLIFGVVLFLIVTVSLLTPPLIGAVNQISSWTVSIQPPSIGGNARGQGHRNRGGGEDNSNNQGNSDTRNGGR